MTEVNISIEDIQGMPADKPVKVIHVVGQLDESNVDEKVKEIYKLIESNPKNLSLIFDFQGLEYMNSKSIGYITDLYGKLTESGGKVLIAGAKPNILDILQVVGLTQLIPTFDGIKEASESLQGAVAPKIVPPEKAAETTPSAQASSGSDTFAIK